MTAEEIRHKNILKEELERQYAILRELGETDIRPYYKSICQEEQNQQ